MYIIKNAFRCIGRAKGRNIIIGLLVVLLSISSCLGLSIRQANKTLKKQYADNMEISATLNSKSRKEEISLDTLNKYAKNKNVKSFSKTASLYFSAGDEIEPIDVAGSFKQNKDFRAEFGDVKPGESQTYKSEESSSVANESMTTSSPSLTLLSQTNEESPVEQEVNPSENQTTAPTESFEEKSETQISPPEMPQKGGDTFITNNFFFNMASMNDFTLVGADDNASLPEYVSELNAIKFNDADYSCVISKNLADENEIETGDTFTLKNPENEDEVYTFTVVGIGDSSESADSSQTASNATFTDNYIYVNSSTIEDIVAKSSELNGDAVSEDKEDKKIALSPSYSGKFVFANLSKYNSFKESVSDDYTVISEDVSNYEESIKQLETLGKYATYFLIVIFIIGAFVLVIINLFSIRNRKYEIGVLTAIGMKKYKVALQFITELFVVTFAALIIGSTIGAVSSVPVTNKLLVTVNQTQTENDTDSTKTEKSSANSNNAQGFSAPPNMNNGSQSTPQSNFKNGGIDKLMGKTSNYIASINSAANITVIFEMIGVGMLLTIISSIASMMFIMRYEPLKILNNRD